MIQYDAGTGCGKWYHATCGRIMVRAAKVIGEQIWRCPEYEARAEFNHESDDDEDHGDDMDEDEDEDEDDNDDEARPIPQRRLRQTGGKGPTRVPVFAETEGNIGDDAPEDEDEDMPAPFVGSPVRSESESESDSSVDIAMSGYDGGDEDSNWDFGGGTTPPSHGSDGDDGFAPGDQAMSEPEEEDGDGEADGGEAEAGQEPMDEDVNTSEPEEEGEGGMDETEGGEHDYMDDETSGEDAPSPAPGQEYSEAIGYLRSDAMVGELNGLSPMSNPDVDRHHYYSH